LIFLLQTRLNDLEQDLQIVESELKEKEGMLQENSVQ
jgi:hypothetical protein